MSKNWIAHTWVLYPSSGLHVRTSARISNVKKTVWQRITTQDPHLPLLSGTHCAGYRLNRGRAFKNLEQKFSPTYANAFINQVLARLNNILALAQATHPAVEIPSNGVLATRRPPFTAQFQSPSPPVDLGDGSKLRRDGERETGSERRGHFFFVTKRTRD